MTIASAIVDNRAADAVPALLQVAGLAKRYGEQRALTGWNNCALYGAAAYTCDSPALGSAQEAQRAQSDLLRQIKTCLGEGWTEATERSSPDYVVLHNALRPVSITLSTDQTDDGRHVVHLNVFVRRN